MTLCRLDNVEEEFETVIHVELLVAMEEGKAAHGRHHAAPFLVQSSHGFSEDGRKRVCVEFLLQSRYWLPFT